MRLDFNISPILPACGNAPRRSNVEAGLGNGSTQKKESEREERREKEKQNREKERKCAEGPLVVHTGFERERYFVKSTDNATI